MASDLHRHRKMKELYHIVMESYNEAIYVLNTTLRRYQNMASSKGPNLRDILIADRDAERGHLSWNCGDADGNSQQALGAVMLKKASNTSFASTEGVLDVFIRSRFALRKLSEHPQFYTLYTTSNEATRNA